MMRGNDMPRKEIKPPSIPYWLLKYLTGLDNQYSPVGDFDEEFYEIAENAGRLRAFFWYWKHFMFSVPIILKNIIYWRFTMLKNYLTVAFRNIRRNIGYSIINILGLSVGLACSMIIVLYVINELTYDKYHQDASRIYRIATHRVGSFYDFRMANTPGPLAEELRLNYPQVEEVARIVPPYEDSQNILVVYKDKRFFESRIRFADPEIFKILHIPFLNGDSESALNEPNTIVISQRMAEKYFGDENPMGKLLKIEFDYDTGRVDMEDFRITGIFRNPPQNTHIKNDMLVSMITLIQHIPSFNQDWNNPQAKYTYIKLRSGTKISSFEAQLQRQAKIASDANTRQTQRKLKLLRYYLQPITKIHMYSQVRGELESPGNWYYIYIYSIVALLILLIGSMNFMNLSAAAFTIRSKEVGLRKVIGAQRRQLIWQFLGESFLVTIIAFIFAFVFASIILPLFNSMSSLELSLLSLKESFVVFILMIIMTIVALGSGAYPAIVLTSFKPVTIFGKNQNNNNSRGSLIQKIFLISQFVISIFLVACSITVFNQLTFMKGKALGFEKEQKLILKVKSNLNHLRRDYGAIKENLLNHRDILKASVSSSVPGENIRFGYYMAPGNDYTSSSVKPVFLRVIAMDKSFIPLYKIKLVAGRAFEKEKTSDKSQSLILNLAGVKRLGFQSAEDAIGKTFTAGYHRKTKRIIGVTKNFHFRGMQDLVEPLVMDIEESLLNTITLSISISHLGDVLEFIKARWKEHFPGVPMVYYFLDEEFDKVYRYEEQMGQLLGIITILGVIIASLGLFGLVSFMVHLRKKEMGIRRVLGATTTSIIKLLSKKYIVLVGISCIFSFPLAWLAINKWLQVFAYRIKPGILVLLLPGSLALIISLFTIAVMGFRAASLDPIETLRTE
jgi:putative ABC transport system permease protein